MATRLKIDNFPSINIKETTQLNADVSAAATSITAENAEGFAAHDFIYLGNRGYEQTEKCQISAISAQAFTVGALSFDHKRFEAITGVEGDQIQLYRATNVDGTPPADTDFATLGSPVDIAADQLYTEIIDNAGGSDYWYKWVFYNSYTATEVTGLSDVSPIRGGDINVYTTVDEVRHEAGFDDNQFITDAKIFAEIQSACDFLDSALSGIYAVPFTDPVPATLRRMAKVLAAGYLLRTEYGLMTAGSPRDGDAKIKSITNPDDPQSPGQLDLVLRNKITLYDDSGNSLRTDKQVSGWPDDTTWQTDETDADSGEPLGGGGPMFTVKKVF